MLTTNIEKEFVRECILSRVRCDGRQLFDYRKLQVTMFKERGTVDINVGSLEVCLGNTRVLARIRADIITPKPDRPSEGPISFKIDTSIKGEESRKLSTEISKLFEKIIKGSNALDPNSLCITTGKYVWSLVCETILLSDDGNIIDAMCYALLLALLDFRKPGVKVEKGELLISEKQVHQALSIHHIPVSFTFGLIENGVFMDPHRKE
jgi:exosome complex component RRP45